MKRPVLLEDFVQDVRSGVRSLRASRRKAALRAALHYLGP